MLLAGVSKYVHTAMWTKYFLFGIALIVGVYTTLVAGIWAVIMLGIVVNLFTVSVTSGKYIGVLIRDFGLFSLAVGVILLSTTRFGTDQSGHRD